MSDWHRLVHVLLCGEASWTSTQAAASTLPADRRQLEGGVFRVGDRVVRIFSPVRSIAAVEGDAAILRHVEDHGFPAERFVDVDVVEGCPVLVTTYVDGRKATPDVDTVRQLGDLLGRLHAMPLGELRRPAGALHHWAPDGGGVREVNAAAHAWLDRCEARFRGDDVARLAALRARIDDRDDLAGLPVAVCHPDFSHDNALAGPVLVDWSGGGVGPRVQGVMTLLLLAVFRNPAGPQLDLVDAALAGYREHISLASEEIERMVAAMRHGDPIGEAFGVAMGHAHLVHVVAGWDRPNRVMDELVERVYSST